MLTNSADDRIYHPYRQNKTGDRMATITRFKRSKELCFHIVILAQF
jgi:hypothetical protein